MTEPQKLEDLEDKLRRRDCRSVDSLAAQVQALALCKIATELEICRDFLEGLMCDTSKIARGVTEIDKTLEKHLPNEL
jgi:hypothetical protein